MPFECDDVPVVILADGTYVTQAPVGYRGRTERFEVPAGFATDLASVPRFLAGLVPIAGVHNRAAILHDWLITEGLRTGVVTSREADGIFRRVMRESGVPVLRRWLMWTGVRWGALTDERRRQGWLVSLPGVLAISVVAAPLVLPPAVAILPALAVYTVAERLVGRWFPTEPQELVLATSAR